MASEKDYHGKQNYVMILGIITVLLIAMVGVSLTSMGGSTKVLTIVALAAVQFYVVLSELMHLKFEPTVVKIAAYLSVIFIILFMLGTAPDTLKVDLEGKFGNGSEYIVKD